MATLNFNELTNSAEVEAPIRDPMFHWDTHFPERVCRLRLDDTPTTKRKSRKRRDRNNARYKTQPITFDEIKEMDEESVDKDLLRSAHSLEGLGRRVPASRPTTTSSQHYDTTRSSEESMPDEASAGYRGKGQQHRRRQADSIEEIPETAS